MLQLGLVETGRGVVKIVVVFLTGTGRRGGAGAGAEGLRCCKGPGNGGQPS